MNEFLDDFLVYIGSEKGLSPHTIEAYQHDGIAFLNFLESQEITSLLQVRRHHIIDFLAFMNEQGYASSTICRRLVAIKMFFRFLKREGAIPHHFALPLDAPKLWQILPEVLTYDEVDLLLQQPNPIDLIGARDKAIFELLYSSGLRVSELCQIDIYDVDDDFVRVLGKGNKERLVPLGKVALAAIDHYLLHHRGQFDSQRQRALFVTKRGGRIDRVSVWKRIKHYGKQAGISKNISPHVLRHSFATHLLDHGAELRIIQEMLGHACINSTERYTHVSRSHIQKTFEKCHPRLHTSV